MRINSLFPTITCLFFTFACKAAVAIESNPLLESAQKQNGKVFSIHGSNTVGAHLAPSFIESWLAARGAKEINSKELTTNEHQISGKVNGKSVYVEIKAHGSSTGFAGLKAKSADIAMSSRPIKASENTSIDPASKMREQQNEHIIAIDGLAVIVNSANPISTLTTEQLRAIFSGKVKRWSQVGGIDAPIMLFARDQNSGTWDTFKSLVLDKQHPLAANAKRFESNDELAASVAKRADAIGFVALASAKQVKLVAIAEGEGRALSPSTLSIATEDYPLSRRLFMYTPPEYNNAAIQDFIAFSQSRAGQEIVENIGFISQNPISLQEATPEGVPPGYAKLVSNGKRLSINFRFQEGSAELDNKAKQDVLRLAEYLKRPENEGKRVQLIGFGDSKQRETLALAFSKMRALAVLSALHKSGVSVEPVIGFGSYLPVASNDGDRGTRNQRVEVWVYDRGQEIYREEAQEALSASL